MKKTIIIIVISAVSLFLVTGFASYSVRLYKIAEEQIEIVNMQRQIITQHKETIHQLKSWIEITDPDYIIMYRRPCNYNWDWPTWAQEIKDGKPPLRCWRGCDW